METDASPELRDHTDLQARPVIALLAREDSRIPLNTQIHISDESGRVILGQTSSEFAAEVSLRPIAIDDRSPLHTSSRNTSARKQAETLLRDSEAALKVASHPSSHRTI